MLFFRLRKPTWLLVLLALCLVGACAPKGPLYAPNPSNPIGRVALLPLQNNTNDVEGPLAVRKVMAIAMAARQYNVQSLEETDKILREQIGLTLGAQFKPEFLPAITQALNVDGLVVGTLFDFDHVISGLYNVSKVRASFTLLDARTQKPFWENGVGVRTIVTRGAANVLATGVADGKEKGDTGPEWITHHRAGVENDWNPKKKKKGIVEDTAEDLAVGLVAGLLGELLGKATNTYLSSETNEMVAMVVNTMPVGPGVHAISQTQVNNQTVSGQPQRRSSLWPAFGNLDFGKKDFHAVVKTTVQVKSSKGKSEQWSTITRAGNKLRIADVSGPNVTTQDSVDSGGTHSVLIHRGEDRKTFYAVQASKRYLSCSEGQGCYFGGVILEQKSLGKEMREGQITIKNRVRLLFPDGEEWKGLFWNAPQYGGLTVKSILENEHVRMVSIVSHVQLGSSFSESFFEVPKGFKKVSSPDELE